MIWNFAGISYSSLAFWIDPVISKKSLRSSSFLLALLEQALVSVPHKKKNTIKVTEMNFILQSVGGQRQGSNE